MLTWWNVPDGAQGRYSCLIANIVGSFTKIYYVALTRKSYKFCFVIDAMFVLEKSNVDVAVRSKNCLLYEEYVKLITIFIAI